MKQRDRIASAFSQASDYPGQARVQRIVAQRLAQDIAALGLPELPRVLEIGCGTGFLTAAVLDNGFAGTWRATDISPEMVARCRASVGGRTGLGWAELDGEYGECPPDAPFDLICSSLAMQWFDDQAAALTRFLDWLRPGGHCLFTSLTAGTFAEWRAAHAAAGVPSGLRALPGREWFDAILPGAQVQPHRLDRYVEKHEDGLQFMRALRAIGADTPQPGHAALGLAAMRRVMRAFDAQGDSVSYEVITCHYRKEPE